MRDERRRSDPAAGPRTHRGLSLSSPVLLEERDGGVVTLTFNRPDALNACNRELLEALRDRLRALAADDSARVVVLTGAGERAFVAGADIALMAGMDVAQARAWAELGQECTLLLETIPQPTLAAVNGFALGGGCELALACDLRHAAATARFGQPEVNLALIPGWGGTQRLARATSPGLAKELLLTGRLVDAEEALRVGLVNAVFPPEELLPRTLELARSLAAKSAGALALAKRASGRALDGDLADGLAREATLFAAAFAADDAREGIAAFLEKREPRFAGGGAG